MMSNTLLESVVKKNRAQMCIRDRRNMGKDEFFAELFADFPAQRLFNTFPRLHAAAG